MCKKADDVDKKKKKKKKEHVLTQRQVCKKSEHKLCTGVQCKLRRNVGWGWNCFCIGVCAFGDTVFIFKSSTHDRDVHVQFYGLNVSMVRVMLSVLCRSVCWGEGGIVINSVGKIFSIQKRLSRGV